MSDNPYSAPSVQSSLLAESSTALASQGKRFLNSILDNIFIQILAGMAGFVFGLTYAAMKVASNSPMTQSDESMLRILGYLIGLFVAISYYVVTEALFQRTIAKFITNTKVVKEDGSCPSFGQILGRSFARLIPFEALSFFNGKNPVGWHDSLSGTRVVRAS